MADVPSASRAALPWQRKSQLITNELPQRHRCLPRVASPGDL
jgi:hypothetical protein